MSKLPISLTLAAKTLFWGGIMALTLIALSRYTGEGFVYLAFTIVSNFLLYAGFRKNAIFFDACIGVLLWLGFWLKFTIRIAFYNGVFHEATGNFDGSGAAFDIALLVSSCGLLGFIAASFIREALFCYPKQEYPEGLVGLYRLYLKHRKAVLISFVVLFLGIGISNAYLGIYQRGTITRTLLPFGLNGIYTWLLLFGLATFSALIIKFEFSSKEASPVLIMAIGLLESFVSNTAMLSRGFILNSSALLYGAFISFRFASSQRRIRFFATTLTMLIIFFAGSVVLVNYLRSSIYYDSPAIAQLENKLGSKLERKIQYTQKMTESLFIDRWVGVEGVMAVSSYSGLGWDLWNNALKETYNEHETSFYDQKLISSPYNTTDKSKHHFISLPGAIGFFYYPGSYVFLFGGMLIIGMVAAGIEFAAFRLGGGNLILCSLVAEVVAFRYTSLGYVPMQSYLLFGTIALNLIIIFVANKSLVRLYRLKGLD